MHTGSSPTLRFHSRRAPEIGPVYAVGRHLGSGQMAEVYRAVHVPSQTPVAVKFLRPELCADATERARFHREVEAVARLTCEKTVRFYDHGETDAGQLYIVMELLHGEDLRDRMNATGRLCPADVLRVVEQVAASLADAHSAGVIHRDLKPENIQFVRPAASELRVLDFGLAKLHDANFNGRLTSKMCTVGTPAYLAPEVARAGGTADWRADLYALGVITFELLTGQRPFDGRNPLHVMLAHVKQPIPSATALRPELPRSVDVFFRTALAKEPRARLSSAELFVKALRAALFPH